MLTALVNNSGGDLKAAQDHPGHENIATTGNYLHKSDQDRHDAMNKVRNIKPDLNGATHADTVASLLSDPRSLIRKWKKKV